MPTCPCRAFGVEDGALTYKGKHWRDMSGSDQLRVAAAIVRRLNPDCGFVLLDKLEQMDMTTLQEFSAWLEAEHLQAIAPAFPPAVNARSSLRTAW